VARGGSVSDVSRARPAAGGGRWVEVAPERVESWLTGFAERHAGVAAVVAGPETVRFAAADGAVADCHVPFPPLTGAGHDDDLNDDLNDGSNNGSNGGIDAAAAASALASHARRDRRVGVVLVRLGGHAAGVFEGERLVASKVGVRLVHGRSAAGGWSQQRFARRRDKQAREALKAAADVALRVLEPYLSGERRLEAVVLGGDRRAVDELREDTRLTAVFDLAAGGSFLTVPDPRLAVLTDTPRRFRVVRIRLIDS
jgi:hypothetical protein